MATIISKVIITEYTELAVGTNGESIGACVNESIVQTALKGKKLLSLELAFDESEWTAIALPLRAAHARSRGIDGPIPPDADISDSPHRAKSAR